MADLASELARLRIDYAGQDLDEKTVHRDPFQQFRTWLDQALASSLREPNAMALATASRDGLPTCRMVLLKGFDTRGFVFFTNYESHKGMDLDENPMAALTFYWAELERQVRITGGVDRVSPAESDEYFSARPPLARLGAAASPRAAPFPAVPGSRNRWNWCNRSTRMATSPGPKAGAAIGSNPSPLSSGRAAVTVSTIGFSTSRPSPAGASPVLRHNFSFSSPSSSKLQFLH
ncbi:MAG: pyridoxal 5'-phosphate synthase [Paludibaculum sp.]